MQDAVFASIDWEQPWLAPFRHVAAAVLAAAPWQAACDQASRDLELANHHGLPIRFVAQDLLPETEAYEAFISRTGGVPTRDNLHDFFNAIVWLSYPASKKQLNAIQAAEIARSRIMPAPLPGEAGSCAIGPPGGTNATGGATRGKVRDRATIFDENAAVLLTSDPGFTSALRNHDWHTCLVAGRSDFTQTWEVRLFGHALLEKLVKPYKAITAHVWILPVGPEFFRFGEGRKRSVVDALLAEQLAQGVLATAPTHLPVLGVPGWAAGQDAAFYADNQVFRKKRPG